MDDLSQKKNWNSKSGGDCNLILELHGNTKGEITSKNMHGCKLRANSRFQQNFSGNHGQKEDLRGICGGNIHFSSLLY